ncbi:MAG: beta-lactamase family protein [Bacteroidia bacterium]
MKAPILIILLAFRALLVTAQETVTKVENVINEYFTTTGFSGTILVAKNGLPIYERSFGYANLKAEVSNSNDSRYAIASVTKMFTSIRILQLVQQGDLSLDASAHQILNEFDINPDITIHHLLLHISGLPNENDIIYRKKTNPRAFVESTLRNKSKTKIGEFNYNNLDYVLLGLIIEKTTGSTWQKNITEHIIMPLNMANTGYLELGNYPKNYSYPYTQKGKKLKKDRSFYIENFYAAGCMYSTANDLKKLDQALYTEKLLNNSSKKMLTVSYPEFNYTGYGVWNYQYPFINSYPTVMERRGGIKGSNVVLIRLTDQNYTIIILSNDNRFNPDSFGDDTNLREMIIKALY